MDAASTDSTSAVARQFPTVTKIVSEPDNGIYDGMNKALAYATGDIVGILNADDFYFNSDTLGLLVDVMSNTSVDACFGGVVYVDADRPTRVFRVWRAHDYKATRFRHGWMPAHPAFFVRRSCYETLGGFREDLGSAGDYELMLRFLLCGNLNAVAVPDLWVAMRSGGASNASFSARLKANKMDRAAWRINGLHPWPWMRIAKPVRKLPQFFASSGSELNYSVKGFWHEYAETCN